MAQIIQVESLSTPGLEPYVQLTETQLRNRLDPEAGIFIAESPKVIKIALEADYEPISLLCEAKHIEGDAKDIIARCPTQMPVFTGQREMLASITGYKLTRGVLCAMRRRQLPSVDAICSQASRVAIIDSVVDTTNIGAIFRSAAALGIDAVLLTPTSCDPLNRRAIRVSMGTIFQVPWTWIDAEGWQVLHALGFKTVAMALTDESISIDNPLLLAQARLAIMLGTEGDGLSWQAISKADFVAKIPMSHHVDSLNVAAASAIAFWQLRIVNDC